MVLAACRDSDGSFFLFYLNLVFLRARCIVTPMATTPKNILTCKLSVANIAVRIIVIHRRDMVLIFSLKGIPSLERYECMYGPRYLLLSSHLSRLYEEFI